MNFDNADAIASVISTLKDADRLRAGNRTLIQGLFNGEPPYTPDEERENKILVNINWKEGQQLLLQAREQYENAFLSSENFFTVTLPDAPASARKYEQALTVKANAVYKQSRPFLHTMRSKFGSVALHGPGAQMYEDEFSPMPYFVPIEDLMIPTDTEITLDNLTHFAVRRRMTPGKLYRKTIGRGANVDPGWNLEAVKQLLKDYKNINQSSTNWNWSENPERMEELMKQNAVLYDSDTAPSIWAWDFYSQEEATDGIEWKKVILLDTDCVAGRVGGDQNPIQVLYRREKAIALNLDQLLQIQFGDGNNKPPFLYHSVRSLGWILYDVIQMMNRLRSQFTQRVFEDLMMLFTVKDPSDRSRLDKIFIGLSRGIIPEGLSFVKRGDRYEVDPKLVESLMANYKQLMGESTTAYTQDIDNNTNKERTAFEVNTLMQQATKLTSSMLNLAYLQEGFSYREHCRRLTIPNNPDFVAKRFMASCEDIPDKWMDSSRWQVEPVRVLGNGSIQLAQQQSSAIMAVYDKLNPEAQVVALNQYVFVATGQNAGLTNALAPLDKAPHITDTVHDTQLVFAGLMSGIPIDPKAGLVPVEVCQEMLKQMGKVVQMIQQSGGMGTPQQVHGLKMAAMYTQVHIAKIAQDKAQKSVAKQLGDQLGQIMNLVKAFEQRQQEAAKAAAKNTGQQADPKAMAKLQADAMASRQKLGEKDAAAKQALVHKHVAFIADQQRKNLESVASVHRQHMEAAAKPKPNALED